MTASKRAHGKGDQMSQHWLDRAGENMRLVRLQHGWSLQDMLERLREMSGDEDFYRDKSSLGLIEQGKSVPPWDKMLQITRLLSVRLEVLAGLELPTAPGTQYTTTIQGNAYSESVVLGPPGESPLVEQVLARLRHEGLVLACPTCAARGEAGPAAGT